LKTFSIGGVHPHENKLSAHQPIITAEVPAKAVILLGQHIGAPAKPIVAKGDVVKVGTKIAEPAGFVSAAIHSSVSGKVAKIDTIVDASGYAKPAIFIDVEGDEWEETIDRSATLVKECELSSEEIVKRIAEAGSRRPWVALVSYSSVTLLLLPSFFVRTYVRVVVYIRGRWSVRTYVTYVPYGTYVLRTYLRYVTYGTTERNGRNVRTVRLRFRLRLRFVTYGKER